MTDFTEIRPYLDGASFNANLVIPYKKDGIVRFRDDVLIDMCRGKRVIHIGCCDHPPLIKSKIDKGEWLHSLITACSTATIGLDIDADAVAEARRVSGLDNIFAGDITADQIIPQITAGHFDIAVFGEVIEHISNPVHFLSRFRQTYGAYFDKIVITVPNAFRGGNIKGIFKNLETINSDHRFFFTPYTIAKIVCDSGFVPDEIAMACFTKAGGLKTWVVSKMPLLAEDIVLTATNPKAA